MGTSFLLKDKDGRVCGYLIQCDKTIRCRIDGKLDETAEVLCVFDDGSWKGFSALSCEREQLWEGQFRKLACACVVQDGEILLNAGKNALQATREIIRQRMPEKVDGEKAHPKMTMRRERDDRQLIENRYVQMNNGQTNRWPQRRWPPPVCMLDGEYERGIWKPAE